jgi:hypothetical protein
MEKKSISQFIFSRENLLVYGILSFNVLSLLKYHKSYKSFILSSILLIIYFLFSNRSDKIITFLVMINFSFWGVLGESFIISKTGCLKYKYPAKHLNIPYWLLVTYPLYVLFSLHIYRFFTEVNIPYLKLN